MNLTRSEIEALIRINYELGAMDLVDKYLDRLGFMKEVERKIEYDC